jgi:hypothetical protein
MRSECTKRCDLRNRTRYRFLVLTFLSIKLWEPTLRHLISRSEAKDSDLFIEEAWAYDSVQHGDSGLVNAKKLSGSCKALPCCPALYGPAILTCIFAVEWRDNARDVVNILSNYIPENFDANPLPTRLPRVASEVSAQRLKHGFTDRTVVGIGHSMGGCTMCVTQSSSNQAILSCDNRVLAACSSPSMFSSLVLIDAIIVPVLEEESWKLLQALIRGAIGRPANLPSRSSSSLRTKYHLASGAESRCVEK